MVPPWDICHSLDLLAPSCCVAEVCGYFAVAAVPQVKCDQERIKLIEPTGRTRSVLAELRAGPFHTEFGEVRLGVSWGSSLEDVDDEARHRSQNSGASSNSEPGAPAFGPRSG